MKLSALTYQDVETGCHELISLIRASENQYDCIVGIARGGLTPAVMLSQWLSLPLHTVSYSSKSGNGDDKNHDNVVPLLPELYTRILLVDDLLDTGLSVKELTAVYQDRGLHVDTAVLFDKQKSPVAVPTYVWKDVRGTNEWIVFPWEPPVTTYDWKQALLEWVSGRLRKTSRKTIAIRLETCEDCPANYENTCTACGCHIPSKVKAVKSHCPMELW